MFQDKYKIPNAGEKTFLYFCQSDYVHRRTSLDSSSIFCHGGGRLVFSLEHLVLFGNWPKKWEIKDLRKLAIFYKFFACFYNFYYLR